MTNVSVLMPVYNAQKYIADTVESILGQTYSNFEFLITDDGSKDQSLHILRKYATQDRRISLTSRPNKGLTPTMNEMLLKAKGEFIAIIEHDDVAPKNRLLNQVKFLCDYSDVVAVSGAMELIDEKGRLLTCLSLPESNDQIQALALAGHGSLCNPGAMIRREALLKVGGYDEKMKLAHDLDLWLKLGEIGQLANLKTTVVRYRLHSESLSELHGIAQRQEAREACERAWKRRGIEGKFEATESWRPGRDRASRYHFALKYGWWAWNSGERKTALIYAIKAIRIKPWGIKALKLLRCALLKSAPTTIVSS